MKPANDPSIMLFDQMILSKRNRGRSSMFSKSKTDFLSDTYDHLWRTAAATPPKGRIPGDVRTVITRSTSSPKMRFLPSTFVNVMLTNRSSRQIRSHVDERTSRITRRTTDQYRKSDKKTHTQYAGAEWEIEWTGTVPTIMIGEKSTQRFEDLE